MTPRQLRRELRERKKDLRRSVDVMRREARERVEQLPAVRREKQRRRLRRAVAIATLLLLAMLMRCECEPTPPAPPPEVKVEPAPQVKPKPPVPPPPAPFVPEGWITLAVVGAHLTGMPLNPQLTAPGGVCLGEAATAPSYRLYALKGTVPPKPGMAHDPGFQGPGLAVELWALPPDAFGAFVAAIPAPLGIGKVLLADGRAVCGFLCEGHALEGAEEITAFGGWRAYLANR